MADVLPRAHERDVDARTHHGQKTTRTQTTLLAKMRHTLQKACLGLLARRKATQSPLLSLPPELRDTIYSYVASSTTLTLPPAHLQNSKRAPMGLLLACKQTRQEFEHILLKYAKVVLCVPNYDFRNAMRFLLTQDEKGAAALSKNENVWILMMLYPSHKPRGHCVNPYWSTACDELSIWLTYRGVVARQSSGDTEDDRIFECGFYRYYGTVIRHLAQLESAEYDSGQALAKELHTAFSYSTKSTLPHSTIQ